MKKAVWALAALSVASSIVVAVTTESSDGSVAWMAQNLAWSLLPAAYAITAALIIGQQPRNLIGWLLMISSIGYLSGVFVANWVNGFETAPSSVTVGLLAALAYDNFSWVLLIFPIFQLLLVFPTGKLVSRRWRWVVVLEGVMVAAMAFFALFPQHIAPFEQTWEVDNPIGLFPNSVFDSPLFLGWSLGLVVVTIAGVVSLVIRYRRAQRIERQQIKWLVFAVAIFAFVYIFAAITEAWSSTGWIDFFLAIALTNIGTAIAFAVLRYHLFDIDRIITRTVAYALVVATLTIGYLIVVVGVGAVVSAVSPSNIDLPIPLLATALVAVGFQPVRIRALRIANRLVFGRERTPYEALAGIERVERDDLLPRVAQLVTESTSARGAIVWLSTGTELEPAAMFPEDVPAPRPIPLEDGQVPGTLNGGETFPLLHQGSLVGALTALVDPGEDLLSSDARLLKDLAAHAATAIKGALEAVPLPDGIVTFLMTDIQGSTRLWDEDPERMAVALRKHDELAQQVIRDGGGVLVKWRGEGDSTFSVFTDPGDAVAAAMALQGAIQSHQWDLVRPISIRAALHTGEAELRERDYFGQTVNRCARIRSLVQGGQTLVSAATRELARATAPSTIAFRDLGEHELRDFKEPERIYEVIAQTEQGPTKPQAAVHS